MERIELTNEIIGRIDLAKLLKEQQRANRKELSDDLRELTNGIFEVCAGPGSDETFQLYWNRGKCSFNEALDMLNKLVDPNTIKLEWDDRTDPASDTTYPQCCYSFKIHGVPSRVVLTFDK